MKQRRNLNRMYIICSITRVCLITKIKCLTKYFHLLFTVQEQLMESLERLMVQSENDAMMADLMQERMNGIQSTVAQYHRFEEENDRATVESKEQLEKLMNSLVSD